MSTAPKKSKKSRHKGGNANKLIPAALAAFANGADASHQDGVMPWEGKDDKRRVNQFVTETTDAEVAKLRYIGKPPGTRCTFFCVRAVRRAIEAGIA